MPGQQRTRNLDGNSRLTAIVGIVISPLFAVAFITGKLAAGGALEVHVAIGLVLAAPVGVKLASVTYRMVSYYPGVAAYRVRGRPSNRRRLMGGALGVVSWAFIWSPTSDQRSCSEQRISAGARGRSRVSALAGRCCRRALSRASC